MTRSLIWKEWHEQRWKLAFGAAILGGFAAVGLRTRLVEDALVIRLAVALGALLLPILVSMGVIAADRAQGTLPALLALPVPPWRVLWSKLAVGWLACAAPLFAVAGVAVALAGGRELTTRQILTLAALGVAAASLMLLWTLALSVRQPTEARAGMVGLGFLVLGIAPYMFVNYPFVAGIHFAIAARGVTWFHPVAYVWEETWAGAMSWLGRGEGTVVAVYALEIIAAAALLAFRFARLRGDRA